MTTHKNGAAIAGTNGKKVETTVPVVKLPAKPQEPGKASPEPPDLPPLEDRVLKIQMLSDTVTRRDKLQNSLKELQSLKISGDDRSLRITIEDGHDEWETTNSDAIKFCTENLIAAHKERIAKLEEQIRW